MPQTEKLPTLPPSPPGSNGHRPEPDRNSPAAQMRESNRIFRLCLLPAVIVVALFCIWLGYQDIYGTGRTAAEQHRIKVQVYRPPIKHPKPPKPPKVKPPPPPKIVHVHVPPPKVIPRFVPHPPPPAPRAPAVGTRVKTPTPTAVDVGPVSQTPVTVPQTPGTDTRPTAPPVAPPAPPPPVIEKAPPAPVVVKAPPPPPPPVVHPKGWVPIDSQEAHALNSLPDPDIPQDVDQSTLHSCTVTWDVDEQGHVSNAHVTGHSGDNGVDQACVDAVQQQRFSPAIQDHLPRSQRMSHTFNFSG